MKKINWLLLFDKALKKIGLSRASVTRYYVLEHEKTVLTYQGKTYLFSHIDRLRDTNKPWVYGLLKKADGKFGKAVHRLYDCWEIAK